MMYQRRLELDVAKMQNMDVYQVVDYILAESETGEERYEQLLAAYAQTLGTKKASRLVKTLPKELKARGVH